MKRKINFCKHPFDEYPETLESSARTYGGLIAALPEPVNFAMICDGDRTLKYPECSDEKAVNSEIRIIAIPGGNKKSWRNIIAGVVSITAAALTGGISTLIQTALYTYGAYKVLQGSIQMIYPAPKTPKDTEEFKNAYSISGGSNPTAIGNPQPFVLGKYRVNPCIVGNYYTTVSNNTGEGTLYGTACFCLGQRNLVIKNIRLGDNILSYNESGNYGSVKIDGSYDANIELTNGANSSMYNIKYYEQSIGAEAIQQTLNAVALQDPAAQALIAQYNAKIAQLNSDIKELERQVSLYAALLASDPFSVSARKRLNKKKAQLKAAEDERAQYQALLANLQAQTQYVYTGSYKNTFTTPRKTDRFTVIFGFQGLGKYDSNNNKAPLSRNVCILYRPADIGGNWTLAMNESYTAAKPDKALVFYRQITPSAAEKAANPSGKWEVVLFSQTAASTTAGEANKLYFQSLQSQINDSVVRQAELEQLSLLTMRIQADANTQGNLQKVSAECQSICPIWNGTDWNTSAPTSNPAALFRFVCQQYFENGFDENSLDNEAIVKLYNWCQLNGYECNAVISSEEPLLDILNKILSSAQAQVILRGGKLSIWHDTEQDNPVALLTPKNSSNFQGTKILNNRVAAYRVRWNDPNADYKETTSEVYLHGESRGPNDDIQDIDFFGLTNQDQVYKLARYALACGRLRPETYTLNVGIEHYNLPFGARVYVASDVLGVSDACGRTIGTGTDEIGPYFVIDEIIAAQTDTENPNTNPYYIRIQNVETGVIGLYEISRPALATNKMRFADSSVELPPIGSIYAIGELDTLDCIIIGKDIQDDDTCQLTLTAYDEGIYRAIAEEIPEYNPKISSGTTTAGGITLLTPPGDSGMFDQVNQRNQGGVFYDFGLYAVYNNGFKNQGTLGEYSTLPTIGTLSTRNNAARGLLINWLTLQSNQTLQFLTDNILYNDHTISFAISNITGEGRIMEYYDQENNNRLHIDKLANGKLELFYNDVFWDFDYDWTGEHLLTYSRDAINGNIMFWIDDQQMVSQNYLDIREVLESEDEAEVLGAESGEDILTSESRYIEQGSGAEFRDKYLQFMLDGVAGDIATIRLWNIIFDQKLINQLYSNDYITFGVATLADYRGEFDSEPEKVKIGDAFVYTGETNAQFLHGEQYWLTEGGWILYKIY